VVAEFDDLICKAITRNDEISELFDKKPLKIKVTTSKRVNHLYDKEGCYV